jgi:hypothetical protein
LAFNQDVGAVFGADVVQAAFVDTADGPLFGMGA